jgi:hypothetical protein
MTTAVRRIFPYRGLAPLNSIVAAISATNPDLLVCGDDLAVRYLHNLHAQNSQTGKSGAAICALIERSIGAPENFGIVDDRASFMRVAQQAGVRVPQTAVIADHKDLEICATQLDFPMVLKANGTSGGDGVRIVHNLEEAKRALRTLHSPPRLARAVKRALFDRNTNLLWPSILRRVSALNAQSFVDGREATSAVACWNGEILAELHFEVLQKSHPSGPSTVLRRIAHPEMIATAKKMARRLQLSGLHGFDFMLDREFHHAYLIEINPRVTQVGHLSFGPGHDLPGALRAALLGVEIDSSPSVTDNDVITLFPKEWQRDPLSPYLRSGYHDVPWDQPELVRSCIRKPGNRSLRKLTQRRQVNR